MSRTIRKRFASNKKQKSQFVSHTNIQSNQELEESWIFLKCQYKSLNLYDHEKQKKITYKIFHSDNQRFINRWTKSKKFFNKIKEKSKRNRDKSLLIEYTRLDDNDFFFLEEVYSKI